VFKPDYRRDVDGLRAVAVLAVIGYHAFPDLVRGGFVGVDVFFVISGFLISTIIFQSLGNASFSYREFYQRRIRRIFPALAVVLLACVAAGRIILFPDEFRQLGMHVLASATFVLNFVLWQENSYFDNAAETKPLLHLWSLAIEEQFYVLWPLILGLAWMRRLNFLAIASVIGVVSFMINVLTTYSHPTSAFYSPASRFWELMAGGCLAHIALQHPEALVRRHRGVAACGLLAIAGSAFFLDRSVAFPGWWALAPVGGACLLIASPRSWINERLLGNRLMVGIGLISYPLYLWHWPMLSFARIWEGSASVSTGARVGLVVLSFVAAWMTYTLVERPIRNGRVARPTLLLASLLAAVGALGATSALADDRPASVGGPGYEQVGKWNYSTNESCLKRFPYEKKTGGWWFCVINRDAPPTLIILGNSFANALYPGLAQHDRLRNQTILSIGACDLVKGIWIEYPRAVRENPCLGRERQVDHERFIDEIVARNATLRYAILESTWPEFDAGGEWVNRNGSRAGRMIAIDQNPASPQPSSLQVYVKGLAGRIEFLERRGVIPIFFLPKPEIDYDVRECFARPFKEAAQSCVVTRNENVVAQAQFVAAIRQLQAKHPGMLLFDPYDVLCTGERCGFFQDGMPLLRDKFHLSEFGSGIMANRFVKWAETHLPSLLKP
jgi:peptidoglycan/LPS O-acetylase OafA/YrhL